MRVCLLLLLMGLASIESSPRGVRGGGARFGGGGRYGGSSSSRFGGSSSSRFGGSSSTFGSRSSGSIFGSRSSDSILGSRSSGAILGSRISGSILGSRSSNSILGSRSSGSILGSRSSGSILGSRSSGSNIGSRSSSIGSRSNIARNNWGANTGRRSGFNSQGFPNNYGTKNFGGSFGSRKGYGFKSSKGKGLSFRTPGYGTNWGTSFGKGKHSIGKNKFSKKALGLGVAAGFVGGAAIGGVATYGVYHRYNKYRELMYRHKHGYGFGRGHIYDDDFGWGDGYGDYYTNYYLRDRCFGGCPSNSICRYGFCECPYGYTRRWGRCSKDWTRETYTRPNNFDLFSKTCTDNQQCWNYDLNLICNTNLTTTATGRCQCRTDMKWNTEESECQLYLDVDCSKFTYDTPADPVILEAVNKTIKRIEAEKENKNNVNLLVAGSETDAAVLNETAAIDLNNTLSNSLLGSIDPKNASSDQITEAYCRDIDTLSFEFQKAGPGGPAWNNLGAFISPCPALLCFLLFHHLLGLCA